MNRNSVEKNVDKLKILEFNLTFHTKLKRRLNESMNYLINKNDELLN